MESIFTLVFGNWVTSLASMQIMSTVFDLISFLIAEAGTRSKLRTDDDDDALVDNAG